MSHLIVDLLENELVLNEDCFVTPSGEILGFDHRDDRIASTGSLDLPSTRLTKLGILHQATLAAESYHCGEGFSHGSIGFFYKVSRQRLHYALVTTMCGPFVRVDLDESRHSASYVTTSGKTWTVHEDEIASLSIS